MAEGDGGVARGPEEGEDGAVEPEDTGSGGGQGTTSEGAATGDQDQLVECEITARVMFSAIERIGRVVAELRTIEDQDLSPAEKQLLVARATIAVDFMQGVANDALYHIQINRPQIIIPPGKTHA